jgi:hypothetical protein
MAAKKEFRGKGVANLIRSSGYKAKSAVDNTPDGGDLCETALDGRKVRIFNVLQYAEASWGLDMKLFPVQRFIVKLYYHIPLDNTIRDIQIPDMFKQKVLYTFTEVEYLHYLFNEGRCNIGEQDHIRRQLILPIGRRSGKTTLSAVFASYELYRLISMGNPQKYYGLPNGNRIQIISVATDKDQAGLLFNDVTAHLTKCEFFKPYVANNTQSLVQFRTPYDIEKYGPTVRHENGKFTSFNGKASLRVTFKASVSKGLRGSGNIMIILDEMAHFQDKGNSSAKDIYDAVAPSTMAFSPKDPKDSFIPVGPVESRIISISSPLNRSGKFYELFHFAMSRAEGSENMLAIQAPTWEVNPTVEPEYLRQKYHEDPTVFMTEYGADFSDRVRAWIERDKDLLDCIVPERKPRTAGPPRYPHQMGIDVGVSANQDGTAIVVTHLEGDKVVMDYHEVWYAGTSWRESNPHLTEPLLSYARTIEDVDRLDFDEISNWIYELCRKFHISDGIFDRWNGLPLEQSLHKKGLKQFKSEFFTRDQKSRMFQATKLTMMDHRLELYDYPLPKNGSEGGKHSAFINELLTLEATQFAKSQVTVEAPKIAGAHDDISDALVRSVWLSLEKLVNTKVVARGYSGTQGKSLPSLHHYQVSRMRSHGIVRDRMVPKALGRRFP